MNVALEAFLDEQRGFDVAVEFGAGQFDKIAHVDAGERIGIEICEGYVEDFAVPGVTAVCGDMRKYDELIDNPHGVALFVDSLEHLEKQDGEDLLRRVQNDFQRVAVFAPVGHCSQESDAWGYDNDWQRHRSTWEPCDLEALGFVVRVDLDFDGGGVPMMFATWDLVPRRAFCVWTGAEESMPWLRRLSVETFRRYNPEWTVDVLEIETGRATQIGQRSDARRYRELAEHGGVYFDTDIVFFAPLPVEIQRSPLSITIDRSLMGSPRVLPDPDIPGFSSVALLASKAGSEFFSLVLKYPDC